MGTTLSLSLLVIQIMGIGIGFLLIIINRRAKKQELIALADRVFEDLCNPEISVSDYNLDAYTSQVHFPDFMLTSSILVSKLELHQHAMHDTFQEWKISSYTLKALYLPDLSKSPGFSKYNIGVSIFKGDKIIYKRCACIEI